MRQLLITEGKTFRKFLLLFIFVILTGGLWAIFTPTPAYADTPIFVRPGGSDTYCVGIADVDFSPGVVPACAVQTLQQGVDLAGSTGTVVFHTETDIHTLPLGQLAGIPNTNELIVAASVTTLTVTKTDWPDPVQIGNPLTYTVRVTNTGSVAVPVLLLDELPHKNIVTQTTATYSQGTCAASVLLVSGIWIVDCSLGFLGGGAVATVTVVVTPTAAGVIYNKASASSSTSNVKGDNKEESTRVTGVSDLSISKTASPNPVTVNTPLTYTITVTNAGPSAATGITLVDNLPGTVLFGSVSPTPECTHNAGQVTCQINFLDGLSDTATITLLVTPTVAGTITNTVTVTGGDTDNIPGNNVATQTTTVQAAPNFTAVKSADPPGGTSLSPNNTITYTIVVNNSGGPATTFTLTDSIPAGTTYISNSATVTPTQGVTIYPPGAFLTFDIANFPANSTLTATFRVTVTTNQTTIISNNAFFFSDQTSLQTSNTVTHPVQGTGSGSGTVFLPIIFKDYAGASASMYWDGLTVDRDKVSRNNGGAGLSSDGDEDGLFKLTVNMGSEVKTVDWVELTSSQGPGIIWYTIPISGGHWVLGIFDGDTQINNGDGSITPTISGMFIVTLYAADTDPPSLFPPDTYDYTAIIHFTDGSSLSATARIPPDGPILPPPGGDEIGDVSDVAVDPDTNQIFVAGPKYDLVYVIDGSTDTVDRAVPVGNGPTGLTVLDSVVPENNKVFAAHQYGANNWYPGVKAFGVNQTVSHDTSHGGYVGAAPVKIAANRTNIERIYVSNYFDKLAVIDGSSDPPEERLGWVSQKGFQGAYGIDASATTNRVYLATRDTGELVVFNGYNDRLLDADYIPTHIKPPQACSLWSVAVNENTGHVFVPCPQLSTVFVLAENQFSVQSLEELGVLEIREEGLALVVAALDAPWIAEIPIPSGLDLGKEGIAIDPTTGYVFITNARNDTVVVLQDDITPDYFATVGLGSGTDPQGVDVNPGTGKVYVGNTGNNTVTVLDAADPFSVTTTILLTP